MKKKGKTALSARLTALCMAVLMAFSLLPSTASAAEDTSFGRITEEAEFTTGSYVMVTDTGFAPQKIDGTWLPADELGTALGDTIAAPADETVWKIAVSGGTATIKDMDGQFLAPKGGNENGIRVSATEYQWKWECRDGKFTFSGQGDDTVILASNRSSQNRFRAYKTTTVEGNPNGYPSEFTLYKAVEGGTSEGTVAAPQADPQAGTVASGTEITLTTSTSEAQIYYTMDGSDPSDETNEARELYGADNMPVITEDCTLKAAAVLEGVYSAVQTLQYAVDESGSGEPGDTAPIADGDQVVIYAPAYGKALSAEYNGYYNAGTDVTEESDGTLSGYTDADVWTVAANEDGTYSFSYNGQNIGMGDSFSSMPLGEKNDKWVLEDAGNGLYYVKNTVREAYMEWYDSNGNWSAYYNIAEGSEGMFALKFYKVTDVPGGSDEPDEPSAVEGLEVEASPQSGASVVAGQQITLKAADGAQIYYTMNTDGTEPADPEAGNTDQLYSEPLEITATPEKDQPVVVKALAYIPQSGDAEAQTGEVYTFTYKAPVQIEDYGLYFGQLHAHTNLSDGTGTVEQAFEHAANVENLDFLALTDHSNSFEGQSGLPMQRK